MDFPLLAENPIDQPDFSVRQWASADGRDEPSPRELSAIVSEGRAVRYVNAGEASADLAHTPHIRQHSQSV